MTTFAIAKLLHLLAMSMWIGGGLLAVLDARRSLHGDRAQLEAFLERMRVAGRMLIHSGIVTLATGLWLIFLKGGFKAVSPRIHAGLAISIAIFAIGPFTLAKLSRLREAVAAGDAAAIAAMGRRFLSLAWVEEVFRVAVLVLMVSQEPSP
jgi:hypothetical protein